ncbi:hypothetical protein DRN73_09535 [Candidatus Pacearchaeota archaeon]|nr:MAG: hypothetical protein DRN73_09535 [Candidatus Pacearchaeota archaeon]
MVWTVKNTGTVFLNNCKLQSKGRNPSWLNVGEVKNLAAGEEHDFFFKLKTPKNATPGDYIMQIELDCDELTKKESFKVEILKKEINFDLIKVERKGSNEIRIHYLLEELSGKNQNIKLQFLLYNENNKKILEAQDIRELQANEKGEFGLQIQVDKNLKGNFNLLINLNSDTYSSYVQEKVFIAPLSGFAILDDFSKSGLITGGAILLLLILIIIILKARKKE